MKLHPNKSVTLIELLIAIALFSMVILAFSSISLFSQYHLLTSERRARVQNELSYVVDHMTKEISKAIGNEWVYGEGSVIAQEHSTSPTIDRLKIRIDSNQNGKVDNGVGGDKWISYTFNPIDSDTFWYCPDLGTNYNPNPSCAPVLLSHKITDFDFSVLKSSGTPSHACPTGVSNPGASGCLSVDYINVTLTTCWDPLTPTTCGTPDKPSATMNARIKMPSVSTN